MRGLSLQKGVREVVISAMLAALLAAQERFDIDNKKMRVVDAAIEAARAAGIKPE